MPLFHTNALTAVIGQLVMFLTSFFGHVDNVSYVEIFQIDRLCFVASTQIEYLSMWSGLNLHRDIFTTSYIINSVQALPY